MMYFLDFDRTLFDTDAFNRSLIEEPALADMKEELEAVLSVEREKSLGGGASRVATWNKMTEKLVSGELVFAPGYLARFVYPDVAAFLRARGNEAAIVTFGNKVRQEKKVVSALADIPHLTAWYVEQSHKAEVLAPRLASYAAPLYFVDDNPLELARMQELCPEVRLFEMRRDGAAGDGRWQVVHSLADLP